MSGALLAAQGHQESWSFNPKVIDGEIKSPTGAIGIAQFMPKVWPKWGTGDPRNPRDAIPAQARYDCALANATTPYGQNTTELMLSGYNAGINAVKKYHGVPPFKETRTYIGRIKALAHE